MFRLSTATDAEPFWVDVLDGVRIQFRPAEPTPLLLAARRAAGQTREAGGSLADAQFAFIAAAAEWGALAWEGVGGETGEEPLPLTPESLRALLRQSPKAYDAVDAAYVTPALLMEQEKNASSPSPNGTSTEAKATAGNARKPVPSARTGQTKSARSKASRSGG